MLSGLPGHVLCTPHFLPQELLWPGVMALGQCYVGKEEIQQSWRSQLTEEPGGWRDRTKEGLEMKICFQPCFLQLVVGFLAAFEISVLGNVRPRESTDRARRPDVSLFSSSAVL